MARKTVGYVHLEWTCPNCQTENLGVNKFCNGCGAPQPEDVEFHQMAEEKLIEDEAMIARAKAGPDVHCPYCNARNTGDAKFCGACGGDLKDAVARESGRVLGAHRDEPAPDINCPNCGSSNPATAQNCSNCGASLAEEPAKAAEPRKKVPAAAPRKGLPVGVVLGGILLCLAFAAVLFLLFGRTEERTGEVRAVSWTRSIPIQVLGPVEYRDWWDEIPAEAEIGSCQEELRDTLEDPAPNSIEVCGTAYTVDSGSGVGEVVQDCYYEVYDDYCSYTVMAWTVFDSITLSGSDLNPRWPEVNLEQGQREGTREEEFQVVFYSDGKTYDYTTSEVDEFTQFTPGSSWVIEVNSFGTVVSVAPAE
jgi:hypothetical protein